MNTTILQNALLWCAVINYAILIFWVLLYLFAKDCTCRIGKLYRLSQEQFDMIQIAGITAYKLAIIFFNIVPYIALRILG